MKFTGIVIGGSRKAAELGFPTANIPLSDPEPSGVYGARVTLEGKIYDAVAFADQERKILEAHLIDFSEDLYGKEIMVFLVKKIRNKAYFSDETGLKEAIAKDITQARLYLK